MRKSEFLNLLRECRELSTVATPRQKQQLVNMLSKAHKMVLEHQYKHLQSSANDDYLQEK